MTKQNDVSLASGAKGVIVGVRLPSGRCPARDFLESLDNQAQAQFKARFERLTSVGFLRNPESIRPLEVPGAPKVWEIKAPAGPGWRLYVIREQTTWVATHGKAKPPNKKVSGEARRARNIFTNWTNDE